MALINIYLKETALTSTKNKYIEESYCLEGGHDSEFLSNKRKLDTTFNLNDSSMKRSILVSTENKFLSEGHVPVKIKKRKKRHLKVQELLSDVALDEQYCCSDDRSLIEEGEEMEESVSEISFKNMFRDRSFCFGEAPASLGRSVGFGAAPASLAYYVSPEDHMLRRSYARKSQHMYRSAPQASFGLLRTALFSDSENIPETILFEMPSYKFEALQVEAHSETALFSYTPVDSYQISTYNIKAKKFNLLNIVSMALMYSSDLRNKDDMYRVTLQKAADDVRLVDPEFILKIALYARQELNIRAVTNFLLAYAATYCNTRMFLEKYFGSSIVLPTDWIEVAEYFQAYKIEAKRKPFPAALRRAMKKTFAKFDDYQLAKYNRSKTKKKNPENKVIEDSEDYVSKVQMFTLKQLIRTLHIDSPAEYVMSLLGKKYPESHKSFLSSGLPGNWDPMKVGKRMKLPVPETWETQISSKGNKPNVWESLIDNNKLPYMAMLRNLKNLILSGISSAHHKKVMNYLENKNHVIRSRQLPLQFFEAYKAVSGLKRKKKFIKNVDSLDSAPGKLPFWRVTQMKKMHEKMKDISDTVVEQYMTAINNALDISSMNNLHPIPGKTLIITELSHSDENIKNKKVYETCILMSIMCLKACEDCKMDVLCNSDESQEITIWTMDDFLTLVNYYCEVYTQRLKNMTESEISEESNHNIFALKKVLEYYLKPQSILSIKLDHIVYMRCSKADENCSVENVMKSFLHKYRQIVNSELLYTNVNFSLNNKSFTESNSSEKDMYLCGSSSSLIKFIASRSSGGQLTSVENIDIKYNLPELKTTVEIVDNLPGRETTIPLNYRVPKWHTVRIFISSTFKDMISERDLLIRYVFPELKRRAASVFVKIAEVDLRWGITESEYSTKKAAELCLLEAQKADLFVGIIGDRYGTVYNFDPPDSPELEWFEDCPSELSITELEIYAAALRDPEAAQKSSFFYFRENSFLGNVPQKWVSHFACEDTNSSAKVEELKKKIKSHNFKVLDGYPCHWAGVFEEKPVLAGLEVLGTRMLEDLWTAVQEIHTNDPYLDDVCEEEIYHQNVVHSHSSFVGKKNSCINSLLKRIKTENGTFVICGAVGSGKTTLMVNVLQSLKNIVVIKFFVGISPKSRNLSYMLQYICSCFIRQLSVPVSLPDMPDDIISQFPDILLEAASCTGGKEMILLIDGLEHFEPNDQRLDWLPLVLPNRVKVVCSASDSSLAFKVLSERQARGNPVFIEIVSPLQQSAREHFVQNYLQYYGITSDEDVFSDHMLKLVTKKESSNPFYLRVACDFLRIYATVDNLILMLQKLPSTVKLVFQEVILQMENEFGSALVQTALSLLCITKEGLEDDDIYYILSFLSSVNKLNSSLNFEELKEKIIVLKPEELLNQVKYCSLMHVIGTFAYGQTRQKSFSLHGTEIEKSVQKFYMNKDYVTQTKYLHCVLSAYYHHICDPNSDEKYTGHSAFAIRGLLYHMLNGCLYRELSEILCNYKFIEAVFREKTDDQLLECYSSLLYDILPNNQKISREIHHQHLYSFYDFVSRNFHIFHGYPCLVMQQALNEPPDSLISLKSEACSYYSVENLSRSLVLDHRLATISGFIKNITALTGESIRPFVLLGSEDGYLKVLDLNARKIIRNIKSHASAITCICYAGKTRVCASSVDGTLSLWDSTDFSQVAVMKGHRYNVTGCCSDPAGSILFSSGWDNSVRLWSLRNGRSISVIDSFNCPINCINHHPLKQQIACGLWNGNIQIWDTVSMEKKLEISNSYGSVKSVAYTNDGINIISSFMQSEVCIWSSEEGLKVFSLKGHFLPVTIISSSLAENIFVSGSDDCTLKVWSSVAEPYFCTISECKFCPVSLIEFLSENILAVAFQNSEIWIFDINNGNHTAKFALESDVLSCFSIYSNVNLEPTNVANNWFEMSFVFGTNSGALMVGNILTSSSSAIGKLPSKITAVIHNASIALCGSADGDIGVFSYPDAILCKTVSAAHKGFITSFCLSQSDKYLYAASTSSDNMLKLWKIDMETLNVVFVAESPSQHRDCITCSTFHPTSYYEKNIFSAFYNIYTGSYDNNIIQQKYDITTFKGLQSAVLKIYCTNEFVLGCGNDGSMVLWSDDGKILTSVPGIQLSSTPLSFHVTERDNKFSVTFAFVDKDGSIKIKKPFEKTFSCSFEGHSKAITSCCIAGSGEVVSCSLDGSVNLWKLPADTLDKPSIHNSPITGLIFSASQKLSVSSDAHGSIVVWKIDLSETSPLVYATKKNYIGGFIRKLSWLKNTFFVCAVTQVFNTEEKYFLDILSIERDSSLSLKVRNSYNFQSEVLSVDSCSVTGTIAVGFKSGEIMIINSDSQKLIKMNDDWILGISFYSREKSSDLFCASFTDGSVELYSISDFMKSKVKSEASPFATYNPLSTHSSKLTSTLYCGANKMICCGDAYGVLRIYHQHSLKFSKRIHTDSISGICIVGSCIFTSSLDRTVKGWNVNSFEQVCQFHLHVPITYLVASKVDADTPDSVPHLLLLGTTSGEVHLLQFHSK